MKINLRTLLGLVFLSSAYAQAGTSIKITVKTYENSKEIIQISDFENKNLDLAVTKNWVMEKQKFNELVVRFLELPGTTDTILKCPRNYIQFDYSNDKLKRREFVCFEKSNSTRKKYIAFAKRII